MSSDLFIVCFHLTSLSLKEEDPFWSILDETIIGCKDVKTQSLIWGSFLQNCLSFDLPFGTRRCIESLIDHFQVKQTESQFLQEEPRRQRESTK